jgi:YesN/AraC family two-component response regulator
VAEKDSGSIKKTISKVMYTIHAEHGISMLAAIGQQAAGAQEWERSFYSAASMLEDDSTLSRQLILTYDGYAQRNATQYYYPLELERDMIHMVIQRKKDRLEALMNHLFQENLERRKIGKDMLNQFIYSLHNTLRRVLHQVNETEDSLFGPETSLLSQMKSCEGGNGLREAVIGMFTFIVDHIQRTNKELDDSMSDRMLAFIHNNYQKDISLVELSEEFNASPAYISILFKNYTGENFKDYLNMYRVEKAKQLLQTNKLLKIHEVAGMVGCNHPNTFIRMFKKYEGVSPGIYAKQSFE